MKILITGGAGYIGTALVSELIKNQDIEQIIVYDNLSRPNYNLFLTQKFRPKVVKLVRGEILDTRKLKQYVKQSDTVIHLAARVANPLTNQDSHLFEQINHWGTAETVYAADENKVSKFIYLSSTAVYGSSDDMFDINSRPAPLTFYGSSKLRGETHVERLFGKTKAYVIRCGNVYGYNPSMRFDSVINRFVFDANFDGRIQVMGDGAQMRSFVHISKVVNVLHNLLTSDLASGTYNLVGRNLSINDVVDLIRQLYPDVESIYVNQHLKLESISVQQDERLQKLVSIKQQTIENDLQELKNNFSFGAS